MKSILENASRLKEAPPPHPGGPLHLPLLPHPLLLPHPPLLPPVPQLLHKAGSVSAVAAGREGPTIGDRLALVCSCVLEAEKVKILPDPRFSHSCYCPPIAPCLKRCW